MEITTLGIDLAKSVFQLHGVDADGAVVLQKKLRRNAVLNFLGKLAPCLIGMEACATSHFWAREIAALGHDVRLIPPTYVKPYVKRQKNDAADAEAICEAVTRPNMRFVPVKSPGQQAVLVLHRSRDLLMRQRTMILNTIRAHLAEFGIVTAQGPRKIVEIIGRLEDPDDIELPSFARSALLSLAAQLGSLTEEIARIERQLRAWHWQSQASQRLETIPGVGLITATALAASVPDPSVFKSGRQFAAWLGLVPRQNSSGGKERLGRVSKMGNGYRIREVTKAESDTIEGLAEQLDLNPEKLAATVREYNDACQGGDYNPAILDGVATQGIEPPKSNWALPINKPPYVAYVCTTGITFTFGGLQINTKGEVQDMTDQSIPGLYAAGELVGGLFYENYPGGTGLMSGSVFGKLAGESAADYVS